MSEVPLKKLSTIEKALEVNLNPERYGTFAEIGAGQEVVRWFFQAGGAAGTVAKSMSAYDMVVSDSIYGKSDQYVSRKRLEAMLEYEYKLNLERLSEIRGDSTAFFSFADTVTAKSFSGNSRCHGWMGVKFQSHPRDQSSQVLIHVNMLDKTNNLQQEAIGIVGVNLLHACFTDFHRPERILERLMDGLSPERIEIDMVEFSGIEFRHVDNRIVSLRLVQLGLSKAAMFGPDGAILQPSSVFRKKPILVERGSFRPVCNVNIDIIECARRAFAAEESVDAEAVVPVMEITMSNLLTEGKLDLHDFMARSELLGAMGYRVLISDYFEYFRLSQYLHSNTNEPIGLAMGANSLVGLFDEKFYTGLDGGILEALGRLFKTGLKLYIYPWRDPVSGKVFTVQDIQLDHERQLLFNYLVKRKAIVPLEGADPTCQEIFSRDILARIKSGDRSWEKMVPAQVAEMIRKRHFFGYKP